MTKLNLNKKTTGTDKTVEPTEDAIIDTVLSGFETAKDAITNTNYVNDRAKEILDGKTIKPIETTEDGSSAILPSVGDTGGRTTIGGGVLNAAGTLDVDDSNGAGSGLLQSKQDLIKTEELLPKESLSPDEQLNQLAKALGVKVFYSPSAGGVSLFSGSVVGTAEDVKELDTVKGIKQVIEDPKLEELALESFRTAIRTQNQIRATRYVAK